MNEADVILQELKSVPEGGKEHHLAKRIEEIVLAELSA